MKTLLLTLLCLCGTLLGQDPIHLSIATRTIRVKGQEATVYSIVQPNGTLGLTAQKGDSFDVILDNRLDLPSSVHWHGVILPSPEDGVAFITQYPLYPGIAYHYQFPIVQAGTYWMHSHFSLQTQRLLLAPLIFTDPAERHKVSQDLVVMLNDFSFTPPMQIYESLLCRQQPQGGMKKGPDLVDVNYDAFLMNFRTPDDPEVISVQPGSRVRIRLINSASATNFFVDLGSLEGEAIATDGNPLKPVKGTRFQVGIAERLDLLVTIPQQGGAFPLIAQGEGTAMQAGLILATPGAQLPSLSAQAAAPAGPFSKEQELHFEALNPLPSKPASHSFTLVLEGNMQNYRWSINGQFWPNVTPLVLEEGKRVEIVYQNNSMMSHPMHLHGHIFQVTAIDGRPLQGALRDTVLVPPRSTVTIQFDADNPGVWPLHCHNLYHQEGGMQTVVRYRNYVQPLGKG